MASPRAWRCAGIITWWATQSGGLASGGVIVDRNAQQCCNRLGHPAGQQPQPLPGGTRSDPAGVLLGHGDGDVPGRDGRQGSSPGGRRGTAAWPPGAGDRGQDRVAVLQPLAALCRPATLPSWGHRWGAAGPCPRTRRYAEVITWWCEIRSSGACCWEMYLPRRCCKAVNEPVQQLMSEGPSTEHSWNGGLRGQTD